MNSVSTLVASCSGLAVSVVGLAIARRDSTNLHSASTPTQPQPLKSVTSHFRSTSAPLLGHDKPSEHASCASRFSIDSTDSADSSRALPAPVRYPSLSELTKPLPPAQQVSVVSRSEMSTLAATPSGNSESTAPELQTQQVAEPRDEYPQIDSDQSSKRAQPELKRSSTSSSIPWLARRPGLPSRPVSMVFGSRGSNVPAKPSETYDQEQERPQTSGGGPSTTPSTSRLPIPMLRKYSARQSKTSKAPLPKTDSKGPTSESSPRLSPNTETREQLRWRNFFTPRITEEPSFSSRRSSYKFKQIIPDPSHQPVLLSASEQILPSSSSKVTPPSDLGRALDQTGRRHFSAPLSSQRPSSSRLSLSLSHVPREIMSKKRSDRRRSEFFSDRDEHEMSQGTGPEARPNTAKSKRSSLMLSLRQISYNRVSSASMAETQTESKTAVRDFSSPTISSIRRSEPNSLNPPKRRNPAQRPSPTDPICYATRPSSASTAASSLRDISHTPTIDSILSSSRPCSAADQSYSPEFKNRTDAPRHDYRRFSDVASDTAESEFDIASQEDDFGFSSADEAMYDSVRTRATSTSSALRVPDISKIFDPPDRIDHETTPTQQESGSKRLNEKTRHSIIEEEESNPSTPSRKPPRVGAGDHDSCLSLRRRSPDETFPEFLSTDWAVQPEQAEDPTLAVFRPQPSQPKSQLRLSTGSDMRSNIFDWAEQKPPDSAASTEFARPKTVHGKKPADARGGRTSGRRIATGIHARSQSVPVAQEVDGKRVQAVNTKFGTWGVGGKGVTEDWNEDFDFDFGPETSAALTVLESQSEEPEMIDSAKIMVIPNLIKEQQSSVLANISLLRDWGLLIEELKELKIRATTIGLLPAQSTSSMWYEVDAMVDLADHESQGQSLAPNQSSPPSPDFSAEAFNEPIPADLVLLSKPAHTESAVESPSASPVKAAARIAGRPRTDSEAVARSVIEALQQKRNVSDPTSTNVSIVRPSKKVPFDTATLRRIVPHVQELRDKVKSSIREAEGLYDSPKHKIDAPDSEQKLRRIFQDSTTGSPSSSPAAKRKGRRSITSDRMSGEDDDGRKSCSSPEGLESRISMMAVV